MDVDEVLFNFMLNSNIQDIKKLCLTNKKANNICRNSYFWETKLIKDNLFLSNDMEKSMRAYDKLYKLRLLDLAATILNETEIITFNFSKNDDILYLLPPRLVEEINEIYNDIDGEQELTFSSAYAHQGMYELIYMIYDNNPMENEEIEIRSNLSEMKSIMATIFYDFPHVSYDIIE